MGEPEAEAGAPATDAGAEASPAPDWMARCEMLQARIEALEQQVEALMVTPRTTSSLIPEGLSDFPSLPREDLRPATPAESLDAFVPLEHEEPRENFRTEVPAEAAAPAELLLRKMPPSVPEIGVLVSAGDGSGLRLAESLTEILARAGWSVRGVVEDTALAKSCRGLTLAVPPTLPLPRVMSTLNALREAGHAMTFQLDPTRGTTGPVLIVGVGAGSSKDRA